MGAGGNSGMKRCKSSISIPSSKLQRQEDEQRYFGELEPTNLFLSCSPSSVMLDNTDAPGQQQQPQRLYLPRSGTAPCSLDVYLKSVPAIADRTEELFSKYRTDCAVADAQQQQQSSSMSTSTSTTSSRKETKRQKDQLDGCDSLLQRAASSQKCLNVLQGEVAHASEDQTDLLISAEATTCHIVALRSTHTNNRGTDTTTTDGNSGGGGGGGALASMAHIDQADVYEDCLEKMVQEHLQHHLEKAKAEMMNESDDDDFGFFMDDDDDDDDEEDETDHPLEEPQQQQQQRKASFLPQPVQEQPQQDQRRQRQRCRRSNSMPSIPTKPVEMELHIAGGYLDEDGTSQNLSTSIVHSFSKLADKYQGQIRISLSTAAISSMNTTTTTTTTAGDENDHHGGPRSRGLALNTHTGEVIPITSALPSSLDGPAMEIRNARLWGTDDPNQPATNPKLAVIHTSTSDGITIDPFHYEAQPQLDALLRVPDPVLLKVTSTSPQHESDRFCNDLRRTLSFVNTIPAEQVFGGGNNNKNNTMKPLVYSRSSNALNEWQPVR